MSTKTIKYNIKFLSSLGRRAQHDVKEKVDNIVNLYTDRKISQIRTAENLITKLLSSDSKIKARGIKEYDKKIEKFQEQEPLKDRVRLTKLVKRIEIKNKDKPLSSVTLHLNTKDAFPNMPNPADDVDIIIPDDKYHSLYNSWEILAPHKDTNLRLMCNRIKPILVKQTKILLNEAEAFKLSIGIKNNNV